MGDLLFLLGFFPCCYFGVVFGETFEEDHTVPLYRKVLVFTFFS